ncbi:MFS transporter [Dactylosporangium sp. CS-033363]|uniref:MFS transporter n=1 Tax=Dactylosporangium sp. CS-033363 TaxID=3239935 RepID=UPI003D8A21EB
MLVLFGAAAIGLWYFSAQLLQNSLGFTALQAGLGQTPAAVVFVVVARVATVQVRRLKALVLCGSALLTGGFGWLAAAPHDYLSGVLGPTVLVAAGIGVLFPALMAAATAGVPAGEAGTAGGVASTANQAGAMLGLAVLATLDGFGAVFAAAAGIGVALAGLSILLPRHMA